MRKYNVGWGITNLCNMNCEFCYSKDTREQINEVGLHDWKRFVDENHELIDSINYGTGENAILDDFFLFIEYVRDNYPNITQSITTNGYLFEKIKEKDEYKKIYFKCIDEVDVSLDFAVDNMHNKFRGQSKAYEWAIEALKTLKKDQKKSTIVFVGFEKTMTKENLNGLFSIAKKYDSMIRMNIYRPVSNNKRINDLFILKYQTLIDGLQYISNNYKVLSINDVLFGSIFTDETGITENTGIDSIRILADGSICPSTYLISENYRSSYNIKTERVLYNLEFKDFIDAPIPLECQNCKIKEKCKGGVYDRRLLWYGTLEKRDPYCPLENDDNIDKEHIKVLKKERISAHDGYLPTIFFKN